MSYVQAAFDAVCEGANRAESWFVVLTSACQCYGGPEEGGWWWTREELVAWKEYPSKELAEAAYAAARALAEDLGRAARKENGDLCLAQCDWLEERGIDSDSFFPEPDGPDEFEVSVCSELPVFGNRKPVWC